MKPGKLEVKPEARSTLIRDRIGVSSTRNHDAKRYHQTISSGYVSSGVVTEGKSKSHAVVTVTGAPGVGSRI